ncbi:MAG: hypothetical protein Q8Q25_00220, partial [bacterium]|nr:hypothetical protein [bacterium]
MKFSTKSFLLCVTLLNTCSYVPQSYAVTESISYMRHVDQKKIFVEQKAIELLLKKHHAIRVAMQAATATVLMYLAYSYSQKWFGSEQNSATGAPKSTAVVNKESFSQWIKNVPGRTGNALITWDTWLAFGKWTSQIGAYAVMNKVFSDFFTMINHSDTLSWFKRTRSPFDATIKQLKEYALLLENNEVAGDERSYYEQAFVSAANTLISDVEKVCAFMQYKLKTSDIPI